MGRNKQKCSKKSRDSVAVAPQKSNLNSKKRKQLNDDDDDNHRSNRQLHGKVMSAEYILDKIFRLDGPPLGSKFDSLPSHAFSLCQKGSKRSHRACQEMQRALKKRKGSEPVILDGQICIEDCGVIQQHGIGKGLMAAWNKESWVVQGHGMGKGLMVICDQVSGPMQRHGVGKGLMTTCNDENAAATKHGIGKGLMTRCDKESGPVKKHGIGKGLMTAGNKRSGAVKTRGLGKGLMPGCNKESGSVMKHGIGKGLMTVWRVTHPSAGDFCGAIEIPTSVSQKKKTVKQKSPLQRKVGSKSIERRKPSVKSRRVEGQKIEKPNQPRQEKCELSLDGLRCQEDLSRFALLVDDEELELRELQAGPNPLTCSAHIAGNGQRGCSLCKDLLAKFPPNSVQMKQPLYMQPWDSSPELVKKTFKVFHFLYTYAAIINNLSSFTLDEFAQAFLDKESLLLGKVHLALLELLLSDVGTELSCRLFPRACKNGKFLALLHSVECQEYVLECWQQSLNPLTWTEILRQVLVAAGFGSNHGSLRRETLNKEGNLMAKYGLRLGTLKGELFSILSGQGNSGLKVSELAKSSQIVELSLASTTHELELLISCTLSSDITLFEKISCSAYRLRVSSVTKECGNFPSDSEDFGSVDDDSRGSSGYCSTDDSENDSGCPSSSKLKHKKHRRSENNMLTFYNEIDESHPGEVWLLGLMEGEYSDLSIEEKLSALLALVDLLSAGPSIRVEDPIASIGEHAPNMTHCGSGAKIKRSTAKRDNLIMPFGGCNTPLLSTKELNSTLVLHPVDSLASISKIYSNDKSSSKRKNSEGFEIEDDLHPMQSIFLGSDRRYNRYWLFLGPCNSSDPGHKRIYFESSEDGHWEVIDTEEALCTLLSSLDCRGTREAFLLASLEKCEAVLSQAMSRTLSGCGLTQSEHSERYMSREDSSSAVSDVDNLSLTEIQNDRPVSTGITVIDSGKKGQHQKQKWERSQAYDSWIWKLFYSNLNAVKHSKRSYLDSLNRCEHCHDLYWRDEKHCRICHTTFELDFDLEERYTIHTATCRENAEIDTFPKHRVLSSPLQSLKAAIYAVESVMPEDALIGAWKKSAHKLWVKRLRRTSTLSEFLQVLGDFIGAINEDWLYQSSVTLGSNSVLEEMINGFPILPQTSSAVALWLVKLDALIAPHLKRVQPQKQTQVANSIKGNRALVVR